jgi:hypothetical protein
MVGENTLRIKSYSQLDVGVVDGFGAILGDLEID